MRYGTFKFITDWQVRTFPQATALSKLHHLKQEVLELIEAIESNDPDKKLEFADCFMLLFGAAKSDGMSFEDINESIMTKYMINLKRNWGTPDENGVVKHIEP
jgi:NTP pyrophosphatase (non-canonical NTP hydrolase)